MLKRSRHPLLPRFVAAVTAGALVSASVALPSRRSLGACPRKGSPPPPSRG